MNALQRAITDVIRRARAGDQVAMALLVQVRLRAQQGNKRAQQSFQLAKKLLKATPPEPTFGGIISPRVKEMLRRRKIAFMQRVCTLANGAPITKEAVFGAEAELPDDARKKAFRGGFRNWKRLPLTQTPQGQEPSAWLMGNAVAYAAAIQRVRNGAPLIVLCPIVAWELELGS